MRFITIFIFYILKLKIKMCFITFLFFKTKNNYVFDNHFLFFYLKNKNMLIKQLFKTKKIKIICYDHYLLFLN